LRTLVLKIIEPNSCFSSASDSQWGDAIGELHKEMQPRLFQAQSGGPKQTISISVEWKLTLLAFFLFKLGKNGYYDTQFVVNGFLIQQWCNN
jgi:hypothetical protein